MSQPIDRLEAIQLAYLHGMTYGGYAQIRVEHACMGMLDSGTGIECSLTITV